MPAVRLIDVAERAGVSMKTVSNVVNNYPHVRPEMRRRVQRAIEELGYRPNATARRLATGKTGMIALALPEINVPYFAELSRFLADRARILGYRVMIEQTAFDPTQELAALRERELGLVDGVICHPITLPAEQVANVDPDYPLVLLGENPAPPQVDHVMIDNSGLAGQAIDHLLSTGHRRIAFVGHKPADIAQSTALRLSGYQRALKAAGVGLDPELVLQTDGYTAAHGERAVTDALDRGVELDALLCHDDSLAIGALRAVLSRGLGVPRDIAIIGWDDIALSGHTYPSLTTVSPDKEQLARIAFDLLLDRIGGFSGPGRHVIAPARLTVRESAPFADPPNTDGLPT